MLGFYRWADEIAPGILMVYGRHADKVENESWRWWGSEVIKRDSEPSRSSFTFCGMSMSGAPSCTPSLDLCSDDPVVIDQGRIAVPEHHMSPLYCLAAWHPGNYALNLRGAQPGPRPWLPNGVSWQQESARQEEGLLLATPTYGPFQSVTEYCQDLPSFEFDVGNLENNSRKARCAPRPGWSGAISSHGPLLEGQLLSVYYDDGNIPVHYCRVALHTNKGWFVTTGNEPCRGKYLLDEMSTSLADTQARPLRWLDNGGLLLIDSIHSDLSGQCRQAQVCGVGPSGIPSCTAVVGAGSKDSREIRLTSKQLKIVPRARSVPRPDGEGDTMKGADGSCGVMRDSYALSFP